jgi:hypothetical protein
MQAELYFPPFQRSSPTSRAAAAAVAPFTEKTVDRIVAYVTNQGAHGATREEIAQALGVRVCSVCGRVSECLDERRGTPVLVRSGAVRISEVATPSQVPAEILIAADLVVYSTISRDSRGDETPGQ